MGTIIPLFLVIFGISLSLMTIINCELFLIDVIDNRFFPNKGAYRIGLFGYYDEINETCQSYPALLNEDEDGSATSVFLSLDKYFHISMFSSLLASCFSGFVLIFVL